MNLKFTQSPMRFMIDLRWLCILAAAAAAAVPSGASGWVPFRWVFLVMWWVVVVITILRILSLQATFVARFARLLGNLQCFIGFRCRPFIVIAIGIIRFGHIRVGYRLDFLLCLRCNVRQCFQQPLLAPFVRICFECQQLFIFAIEFIVHFIFTITSGIWRWVQLHNGLLLQQNSTRNWNRLPFRCWACNNKDSRLILVVVSIQSSKCIPFASLDDVLDFLVLLLSAGDVLSCFELNALSFDGDFDLFFALECFDGFLQ